MHVWWDHDPSTRPTTVEATLEILDPPTVPRLHFWALQATFADDAGRPVGTAHLGLQWYPAHPGSTAVNWGGYLPGGGGELTAHHPSALPSVTGNPNTRDFAWRPHTPYRLTIHADGTGAITDPDATTVVRRLAVAGATHLRHLVVWSEVFARCDDPSTAVRWSDLTPRPTALHATYQSYEDGGCTNTNTSIDAAAGTITQRTNAERTTREGRLA